MTTTTRPSRTTYERDDNEDVQGTNKGGDDYATTTTAT